MPNINKTNQANPRKVKTIEIDPLTLRPKCPECGTVMGKKEKRWSGRHKKQLWICSACGRTKLLPLDFLPEVSVPQRAQHPVAIAVTEEVIAAPLGADNHRRPCDGIVEGKGRPCSLSENGCCTKPLYPMSCLKYDREEWEELPA